MNNYSNICEEDCRSFNNSSLKIENDLFNEETQKKATTVFGVRLIAKNKTEDDFWEITKNGQVVYVLLTTKFSKKEKKFLYSSNGILFLLDRAKAEKKITFTNIKKQLLSQNLS